MGWIKRIGLWTLCVVSADLIVILAWQVVMYTLGVTSFSASPESGILSALIFFILMSLSLLVPGWLVVLPIVVGFKRAEGRCFLTLGAFVTLLGPVIAFHFEHDVSLAGMALAVSFLSIASYLFALRHFSRDSIEQVTT
jgi:hypothetical protein